MPADVTSSHGNALPPASTPARPAAPLPYPWWRVVLPGIPIVALMVGAQYLRFRTHPSLGPWSLVGIYGCCLGFFVLLGGALAYLNRRSVRDAKIANPTADVVAASVNRTLMATLSTVAGKKVATRFVTTIVMDADGLVFSTSDDDVRIAWTAIVDIQTGQDTAGGFWWSRSTAPVGAVTPIVRVAGERLRAPILPIGDNGVLPARAAKLAWTLDRAWDRWRAASGSPTPS